MTKRKFKSLSVFISRRCDSDWVGLRVRVGEQRGALLEVSTLVVHSEQRSPQISSSSMQPMLQVRCVWMFVQIYAHARLRSVHTCVSAYVESGPGI